MLIYVLKLINFDGDIDYEKSFTSEDDSLLFVKDCYYFSNEELADFKIMKYSPNVDHYHDISYCEEETQKQLENGDAVSVYKKLKGLEFNAMFGTSKNQLTLIEQNGIIVEQLGD